jgi:hypothetical protein
MQARRKRKVAQTEEKRLGKTDRFFNSGAWCLSPKE